MGVILKFMAEMLRIFIIIFLLGSICACERADFEKAHRAYLDADYENALMQLKTLANADDEKAQNNLGYMYLNGIGIEKNFTKALKWYREAAQQGVAEAQHSLGFMYAEGLGTAAVPDIALKWYRLSAEQGLSQAQFNLAYMIERGIGIRRDNGKVFHWYEKSAEQGNLIAQHKVASMYLDGIGVEQNRLMSYAWFGVASAGGYERAIDLREAIAIQFNSRQLENARNMARELWLMHSLGEIDRTAQKDMLE
jgi:TPR repeat protein